MATEFYLLSIQGSVNGQFNEVVQCFQGTGVSTSDTLGGGGDLIAAWATGAATKWLACLPQSYFLDRLVARRAFPKPSASAHAQQQAFSQGGTLAVNSTSYNLCPCTILIPGLGVKSAGRNFMPCVPDGQVVNNAIGAGYRTALDAYYNQLIAGLTGSIASWALAIYSRKHGTGSLVVAATHSLKLGFQSRRRRPVGSA